MNDFHRKNDLLVFADEEKESPILKEEMKVDTSYWRILIVDDDEDVHAATKFALKGMSILGRELKFYHAYSAKEAQDILASEKDIAVVFLDVVMESSNAGLDMVSVIRDELKIKNTRIILRTGEPNQAPGIAVVRDYDINDYKLKSEITQQSLYTCLTSALRSYQQICEIEEGRKGLDSVIQSTSNLMARRSGISFYKSIVAQVASLLAVEPVGFICGKELENQAEATIISALGRYVSEEEKTLASLSFEHEKKLIEKSFSKKSNVVEDNIVVLYIGSPIRGEMCCLISSTARVPDIDKYLLELFSSNISICTDNITYVEKLKTQAYHDSLVDLPNRTALENVIDKHLAAEKDKDYALALVDIDNFAEINASLGQEYGDKILQVTADRLKNRFYSPCTVARISSDVFAVFGPPSYITNERIKQPFSDPFEIGGELQLLSVTVGVVPANEMQSSGSEVIKDASIVLKQAKKSHRGEVVIYHHSMIDQACSRLDMLKNLRTAFELDELFLVYQPKLCLKTLEVRGFEALLRWRNREGNFVSPADFIPLAEQSGLIIRMGEWVLRKALSELNELQNMGLSNVKMAVNLSVAQLQQQDIVETLKRVMSEFSLDTNYVELEITESIAMGDIVAIIEKLKMMKAMGFCLAIDDFGTGFSSLNYLQDMPLDCLKIDKSFVQTTESKRGREIVQMIVNLARALNLNVIAEGVETEEQAQLLRNLDCDEMQGFLYARPMPAVELHKWLQAHRPNH